ncbi:MAG: lamin tail domain-containing protein [Candidatus Moranbacteria bacterium]|nr:lamin tail domain-containing protein [Candidatus Moranbacteria bacterium]
MAFKKTNWLFFVMLFCAYTLPLATKANSSSSLVEWTFPHNPDDATADGGTPENISQSLTLIGASTPTYNNTGATTFSARAINWQNGQFQKYWLISLDTRGYQNITLSSKQRSSATGPRDFVVEYRTNPDQAWQSIPGGIVTLADNFTAGTLDTLLLPSDCANQENLDLRFVMSTNTGVNGNNITSTGSSRIDDIFVSGSLIEEPLDDSSESNSCLRTSSAVIFNEIFPYAPSGDQEYVELANRDILCVDISSWRIEDQNHHAFIIPGGTTIFGQQLMTFFRNFYMNNTSPETLYLYDAENILIDSVSYERAIKDFSYSYDGDLFRFSSLITPGGANLFDENEAPEENEATADTSTQIRINELLPNPKGSEISGEYIELFNFSDQIINLKNWSLADSSRKKFTFTKDMPILANNYLVLPRTLFVFSLNNFGTETIELIDPFGTIVSAVTYVSTKENLSYSFKKDSWFLTKHQTPGEANKFSKKPKIHIASKKSGYQKIPLAFKATLKNSSQKKLSYHWDFGDGHTSTLASPLHSYQKTGRYTVTVKIKSSDGNPEKSFTVNIKKYPKPSISITSLLPNPKDKDSGQEWIAIQNTSSKKINLHNWRIATGQDKENLINHPITKDLLIEPGKVLQITRLQSAFSLHNTESIVALRSPDNTTISETSYREEEIVDDAICENHDAKCIFPETPLPEKEKTPEAPKENTLLQKPSEPFFTLEETSEPEEVSLSSTATTTKKEVIEEIGQNLNTLLNLYIQDWIYP